MSTEFGEESFKGKIVKDNLTGIWSDENKKELTLSLSRKSTKVKFYFKTWHQNYDFYDSFCNSSSKIDIHSINVKTSSINASRNINKKIEALILQQIQLNNEDYKTIDDFLMSDSNREQIIQVDCNLVTIENNILCIELHTFIYEFGGTGYFSTKYYYNFNLETGCLLTLEDLFSVMDKSELYRLSKQKYREKYEWYSNAELFTLSDNFAILPTGIVFIYNPTKACYDCEYGANIFINYGEVKSLMSSNKLLRD